MTDARTCAECGTPLPDHHAAQLCTTHAEEALNTLTELPALIDDVNLTITRQTATGARNGPRSTAGGVVAWDDRASKALGAVLARLITWAKVALPNLHLEQLHLAATLAAYDHEDTSDDPEKTKPAVRAATQRRHTWISDQITYLTGPRWVINANHKRLIVILTDQYDHLLTRGDAAQFTHHLTRSRTELLNASDTPAPRLYLGPCRADPLDKGILCPAEVYAIDHSDQGRDHLCDRCRTVRCPVCRTEHDVTQRRSWLTEAMDDRLATAGDIARGLANTTGITATEDQIRGWERRGRLIPHAKDQAQRTLYRVGDVIDLARQAAATRNTDRPASA